MGRLGTQKSIPIRKSKRIQNKQKPPASKTSVAVSPVNRKPTMLKLQVGALVKKNLRLSIIHHNKMAITFGIVKRKLKKSKKWHIHFKNGDNMILLPNEFEMVANDSNQKKLCFTPNKKLTLKTPQEAHIESYSSARKLGIGGGGTTTTTMYNINESSITTNTSDINNTNGSSITNLVSPSNVVKITTNTAGINNLQMEYLDHEEQEQDNNNLK